MTINDQHRAATGTPNGSGPDHEPLSGTHALVDRLHSGEPYAVAAVTARLEDVMGKVRDAALASTF